MKKILLSLFCASLLSGVIGQSFTLQDTNGVAITPGTIFMVLGEPDDDVMTARIDVKNNSAEDKDVKVKKHYAEGDVLANTINYFCWTACYGPDTYESPFPLTIGAGQVVQNFFGDYNPSNVPGKSKITYVFFDMNNRDDSVAVTVEFNASPASVAEIPAETVKFSDAYPNPAVSKVNVDYSIDAKFGKASIVISNMLGSKVEEISLTEPAGTARIMISDMLNGIYFYSLVVDGQVAGTGKFVVKK